tara:strand:- start:942 stop:1235 length:294 start_codon:yes stop_codon:yes gene_type:complete
MTKRRKEILNKASELIMGDRQADYGEPSQNFGNIAKGWAVIFDTEITAAQVALAMSWLKIARVSHKNAALNKSSLEDGAIDLCGYGALFGELSLGND